MIACVRVLPGFWIAVGELERPELRDRPTIIGGLPHQRGTVREANLLAQQHGVRAGMPLSQAHQHCPDAVFLVPDLSRYERLWQKILDLLQTYTPLVESIAMGEVLCDLSGCGRRWRDGGDAGGEIRNAVYRYTGLVSSVGVASNRLTAQFASTTASDTGVTVVDCGQEAAFLAGFPITQLPDVDPRLALSFQVLGLQTVGQFAALPAAAVEHRFGAPGKRLHALARGVDRRPVEPPPDKPAISARYDCHEGSSEEAVAALRDLAARCAAELQERRLVGRLVELTLIWEPDDAHTGAKKGGGLLEDRPLPLSDRKAEPAVASPFPQPSLPVPYRIHSRMAQPGADPLSLTGLAVSRSMPPSRTGEGNPSLTPSPLEGNTQCCAATLGGRGVRGILTSLKTAVRTAIGTAPPLVEQGERLLLRLWQDPARRVQSVELTISEFEAPMQLGFAELMRLDQTGGLGGLGPERRQAIMQQEQVLAARYGDAGFRHVAQVDPAGILTERRFRWDPGLRWSSDKSPAPKARRKRS